MRFSTIVLLLGMLSFTLPVRASVILGFAGVESGVPIAGQEDVVIYNFTGSTFGCSTPNGTPVCTAVTFDNVVLNVNGSLLNLGDIGPGVTETLAYPSGIFPDSTISSLSFSATLSSTNLADDLGNTFKVNPSISVTGLPANGTLGNISADVASVPEPSLAPLLFLCVLTGVVFFSRHKSKFI